MFEEVFNNIVDILKEEDFSKRKDALQNQRRIILSRMKEENDNVKFVILLFSVDLELMMDNEEIRSEQNKLFDRYNTSWSANDLELWWTNYAGFLFEEEREDEEALKILVQFNTNSCEYAEKYSIMGQVYYNKEDFQKAEKCFEKASDLCEKNIFTSQYKEYVLAYIKCLYKNEKYDDVICTVKNNFKELKWDNYVDIEILSVIFLTYYKQKDEDKIKILTSEIKKHKDEIENIKYSEYFDDIINDGMEPEGISICPYSYCPRHHLQLKYLPR